MCGDESSADFRESCPYELQYSGHFIRVPISIVPHQLQYFVGDTIEINTVFSDSIYDLGTQQTFKIQNFPFKPISLLYRFFAEDSFDSGYRVNDLHIDSIYDHKYVFTTSYADSYRATTRYENGIYSFKSEIVLKEAGRYMLLFTDQFQGNSGSGNGELNEEADAITFEGKCPTLNYYICSMIEGDDHLELFEKELVYLDEEVYRGKLGSIESSIGPLRAGGIAVEFSGFFGFEVVE